MAEADFQVGMACGKPPQSSQAFGACRPIARKRTRLDRILPAPGRVTGVAGEEHWPGRRSCDVCRAARRVARHLLCVAKWEHDNDAFAAEAYRESLPKKYTFADIGWIGWAPPFEQLSPNPELEAIIPGFRPAFASDDFIVQLRAAEAGVGAIFLHKTKHRFSRDAALVPLGLDLGPHARSALHLVCAKSALAVPRVRAVAELLAEELIWASRASRR